jgi:radical SAM superfamily enzyme YgiQ (UPF0313 family)
MKILLIWPWTKFEKSSSFFDKIYSKEFTVDISALPSLISVTPKKHDIEIVKATDSSKIDYTKKYDLVGITCIIQDVNKCYQIADKFRENNTLVVLGGWHPSALPKEAKEHADSVVIGEAEETWPTLLNDLEKDKLKPFYFQEQRVDLTKIPKTKTIIKGRKKPFVMASRGCPYSCDFCSISNMKLRKIFRTRPIDKVVDEIKKDTGKYFLFGDSSLTINLDYSKELFTKIKGLNKKFFAFGNINVLGKNEEFLKLASDAGCTRWFIGFESICQSSLDAIKKPNIVKDYISGIKKIHDYNMLVEGGFIVGFDNDTTDIFDQTYDFLCKSGIDIITLRVLTPYPGTPLFDRLEKEDRILTNDWSKYTGDIVVFKPKNMSPEQLQNGYQELFNKIHNTSNTADRMLKGAKYGLYNLKKTFYDNLKSSNIIRYGIFRGQRTER